MRKLILIIAVLMIVGCSKSEDIGQTPPKPAPAPEVIVGCCKLNTASCVKGNMIRVEECAESKGIWYDDKNCRASGHCLDNDEV